MNLYDRIRQWIRKKRYCPKCSSYQGGYSLCPIGCPVFPPYCMGCNRPIWNKAIKFYGRFTCHDRQRCRDRVDEGRRVIKEWLRQLEESGEKIQGRNHEHPS